LNTSNIAENLTAMAHQYQSIIRTTSSQPNMAEVKAEGLVSGFHQQGDFVQRQQSMLLDQAASIHERRKKWLERIAMSEDEKQMLETYWQRQREALDTTLESRNRSLRAAGEAQVRFVQEMCNSILLMGRSNLQANVKAHYQEQALRLNNDLEIQNRKFWDMLEEKLEDAARRSDLVKGVIHQQAGIMLDKWNRQFEAILNEYEVLLSEKI
jgi:hypothetical protein